MDNDVANAPPEPVALNPCAGGPIVEGVVDGVGSILGSIFD